MRAQFVFPALPRNPVLRALALIGAIAATAALLTVGVVVGAGVLTVAVAALAIHRWRLVRAARKSRTGIIEGEFTVISGRSHAELPRPD